MMAGIITEMTEPGTDISVPKSVTLCEDGKFRWVYELDMFGNPTILVTVFKVLGIASLFPFAAVLVSDGFRDIAGALRVLMIILGIMSGLSLIAYVIVALIYGGKYCVVFTMDEDGITHTQQDRQFGKARLIGIITAMAGAAGKDPGTAGAGLLAASRSEIYSDFKAVRYVKVIPKRHLIRLDCPMNHNQIYCESDALYFVEQYIRKRCTEVK